MPDDDPGIRLLRAIRDAGLDGLDGPSFESLRARVAAAVAGAVDAEAAGRPRRRLPERLTSIRRPQLGTVVAGFSVAVAIGVGVVALALHARTTSPSATVSGGGGAPLSLSQCVRDAFGVARGPATALAGSMPSEVSARFGVFRGSRAAARSARALGGLRQELAHAGARSFDPSRVVVLFRAGGGRTVYGVPAMIAGPTLPAGCRGAVARTPGLKALLAMEATQTGSGPGVCMVTTQVESTVPTGPYLPGAAPPRRVRSVAVTAAVCHSAAVLSSYTGAFGYSLGLPGGQIALFHDGIASVTYAFGNGRHVTVAVARNIAQLSSSLFPASQLQSATVTAQLRALASATPAVVTERGADGSTIETIPRPPQYFTGLAQSLAFLRRGLKATRTVSASGAGGGSESTVASCSARSRRCIAVVISTTCDSALRCRISRTVARYRYVGSRPPAGTTGAIALPTAPIVARAGRLLAPPRTPTLVLSGAPQVRVRALVSATCSGATSGVSAPAQTLELPVPSRTAIPLPAGSKSMRACGVAVLILSTRRSAVHAALTVR
jgi:hypothetical protein